MMRHWLKSYGLYGAVTLAIFLPLLLPGFILTTDIVFTPQLRMPESLTNDYPFYLVLHVLDLALPSDFIQKILLVSIVPLAAVGVHRLLQFIHREPAGPWQWAVQAGSLLYAVNPFTYSRFMAGQYLVLLGYALLPWFVRVLLAHCQTPTARSALKLAGITLLIGSISIHTLGLLVVIALAVGLMTFWPGKGRAAWLPALRYGLLALLIFIIGSSYWLIPLVAGQSTTAQTIQDFDTAHASAFATEGSSPLEQIANVLRLQGFWLERYNLYTLPQDQLPGWGTVRLLVWAVVGTGLIWLWRHARRLALLATILILGGLVLSIGVGQPLLTAMGYREPHKFAGLVALGFAIGFAFGARWILQKAAQREGYRYSIAAGGLLLLVVLLTPTMYWGFAGQLSPRHYPADWFTLNQRLNHDAGDTTTLFLPWHQYMSFGFAGRVIANPASRFFDKPVVVSNNPELEGIPQPRHDRQVLAIADIIAQAPEHQDLGKQLAGLGIKYVILAKEFDYRTYNYLDSQPDLTADWETETLKLYRNRAMEGRE